MTHCIRFSFCYRLYFILQQKKRKSLLKNSLKYPQWGAVAQWYSQPTYVVEFVGSIPCHCRVARLKIII